MDTKSEEAKANPQKPDVKPDVATDKKIIKGSKVGSPAASNVMNLDPGTVIDSVIAGGPPKTVIEATDTLGALMIATNPILNFLTEKNSQRLHADAYKESQEADARAEIRAKQNVGKKGEKATALPTKPDVKPDVAIDPQVVTQRVEGKALPPKPDVAIDPQVVTQRVEAQVGPPNPPVAPVAAAALSTKPDVAIGPQVDTKSEEAKATPQKSNIMGDKPGNSKPGMDKSEMMRNALTALAKTDIGSLMNTADKPSKQDLEAIYSEVARLANSDKMEPIVKFLKASADSQQPGQPKAMGFNDEIKAKIASNMLEALSKTEVGQLSVSSNEKPSLKELVKIFDTVKEAQASGKTLTEVEQFIAEEINKGEVAVKSAMGEAKSGGDLGKVNATVVGESKTSSKGPDVSSR